MLDSLFSLDRELFLFLNNQLSNPIFDWLMPLFHHPKTFLPIIIIPWLLLLIRDKNNRLKLFFLVIFVIILADQTGYFLKKLFLRERPWAGIEEGVILLVKQSGKTLSFPSNHAANISGLAAVFSGIYPKFIKFFWAAALTVMFSRIYIGVHYPMDIIAGFLLGLVIAKLLLYFWRYIEQKKWLSAKLQYKIFNRKI